ncbi:MAG: PD40 domain-containing protein [Candidatus Sabulitectum sp.]|nr:PD40 domain-containing protein [Candidatus Sabulitectum sp.]
MKFLMAGVILVFSGYSSEFMQMTPMGNECIPVSIELSGCTEASEALEQLEFDIDFSGILETADRGEGYAHARCVLSGTRGSYTLSVDVDGAEGEMLLKTEYSGSSWQTLIHRFADEFVYLLSGEQGIASTQVAYITRSSGFYSLKVQSLDPRAPQVVISDDEVITTPSWSTDGEEIAFTSYRNGLGDIYLYSFANSSAQRIITGGLNTSPAWTPDSRYIAFTRSIGGNSDIHRYDTASGDVQRLTARGSIETSPSFSPTGQQMILTSDRVGYPQLYIMDSSGGSVERAGFAHGYCDSPSWSPTGDRIAYCARSNGDFHIFVMNADGTDIRQVTTEGTLNEDPVWSPTGGHLAFSSDMNGERSIYLLELNKLTVYRLSSGTESYCATWSPVTIQGGIQ